MPWGLHFSGRVTVLPLSAGRRWLRRLWRFGLRVLLVLLGLALLLGGLLLLLAGTETGSSWAVRRVVQLIDEGIPGSIDFEYRSGTLLGTVHVANIVIRDPAGYEVIRVAEASAQVDLPLLLQSVVHFSEIRASGVEVVVRKRKRFLGLARAFREPPEPAQVAAPSGPPGPWLFELPDIQVRDARVRVDLAGAALTVVVPAIDGSVVAGRGSHRVETRASGSVELDRIGSTPRPDRIAFSGTLASKTGRPVDAQVQLSQETDAATVHFAYADGGFEAEVRGGTQGIDLARYLADVAPTVQPGIARDLVVTAQGPTDDLRFHLATRTDAGAVDLTGRTYVETGRRLLSADARVTGARLVRLGLPDAPPDLAVSAAAAVRADLDGKTVDAELSNVLVTGIEVPGGAQSGTFHADPSEMSVALAAVDGSSAASARLLWPATASDPWRAEGNGRLAESFEVSLPWVTIAGPVALRSTATWDAGGLRGGTVELESSGEVRTPRPEAALSGPWHTLLDARPAGPDAGWEADGWIEGAAGARLSAGGIQVAGPLDRTDASPGEPTGVPVHVAIAPDGTLRITLKRARIASITHPGRGAHNSAPIVADLAFQRSADGTMDVSGSARSRGDLVLGPQDSVVGPFRASAVAYATGGEWRLASASVDAAGARHGGIRAGAITAELAPSGNQGASRVQATVASIRSGTFPIGTLAVDVVGTTRAGGGVVRLTGRRGRVSTNVRLRLENGDTVAVVLEGGLVVAGEAALRFHGSARAGPDGLAIPAFTMEGQGARGSAEGKIRDWRTLQLGAQLEGLPLLSLLDMLPLSREVHQVVQSGTISAHVTAEGRIDRPLVQFGATVQGLSTPGARDTVAEISGRLENGDLHVVASAVLPTGGTVSADVTLPGRGTGVVAFVQATDVPLGTLRAIGPEVPELQGTLTDGSVLVHAGEKAIELRLALSGFAAGAMAPIDGWVDFVCQGRECRDRFSFEGSGGLMLQGDGEITLVRAPATGNVPAEEWVRGARWLQHITFAGAEAADFGLTQPAAPRGTFAGTAVLTGEVERPEGRVRIEAESVSWSSRPELPPLDGRVEVAAASGSVRASAFLFDPAGDNIRIAAEWAAPLLELWSDRDALLRPELHAAGRLAGAFMRSLFPGLFEHGPADRVGFRAQWTPARGNEASQWSISAAVEGPYVGDIPLEAASFSVAGEGQTADVAAVVRTRESEALHVTGRVVLPAAAGPAGSAQAPPDAFPDLAAFAAFEPSRAEVAAQVRARGLNIAGLPLPGVVADVTGIADLELAVHGSLSAPAVTGTFHITGGGMVLVATAQRFSGIELSGSVEPNLVQIDHVAAASGTGRASAAGRIELGAPEGVHFAFTADSSEFPLSGEGTTFGRLSCEIAAQGTIATGTELGGRQVDARVTLGECTLFLPRQRSQQVLDMGDHPDFVVAGRPTAARAREEEVAVPWDVAVAVEVPGEFWVRREDMQAAGSGNLVFRSEPSKGESSSVAGRVELRRGFADMFGRRFDVEFGDVEFTGRHPVDGAIDVRLASETSEGPVYVDVTGTLRHPAVQLTSDPPRDQSEILALLYLGRTDVTSEERVAIGRQADAVAQGVAETVGLAFFQTEVASRLSPMTVLRVDPGQEGLTDARLRAGLNVLSNLYVEYSYQLAADELQNANEGRIEWMILRNLSLEGRFGDAQSGGIHLQFRTEW